MQPPYLSPLFIFFILITMAKPSVSLADVKRPTKVVELSCLPGSEVEIYQKILVADARVINKLHEDKTVENMKKVTAVLEKAIKKWNLVDQDGNPAPISEQTLDQLTDDDLTLMFATASGKTVEELKAEAASVSMGKKKE